MTLEEEIVSLLKKHNLTITTAESCTGGLVAATLINVAGVSEFLKEAYITYSDEAKIKLLNVDPSIIDVFTVVSAPTAKAMAIGGAKAANTDICISVTGIAGPDGGSETQPVGLVYIGLAFRGEATSRKYVFHGSRAEVRDQAVFEALKLAKEIILDEVDE